MSKPLNMQFFKDGNDLVVVFKNCNKSSNEIITALGACITSTDVKEVPDVEPLVTEDLIKPDLEKYQEVIPGFLKEEAVAHEESPEVIAEPENIPENTDEHIGVTAKCPKCGAEIAINAGEDAKCSCGLKVKRVWSAKELSNKELKGLIENGSFAADDFVSAKKGIKFKAKIIMDETFRFKFDFNK